MTRKLLTLAAGAGALFALSLPFAVISNAQDKAPQGAGFGQGFPPPDQQGQGFPPQGQQGQPGPGGFQRGGGFPGGFGGGMGGSAMVDDNYNLYVLQGNRLFKIQKTDLKVVAEANLPMGMPMPPGGPGGQRGGGGGQGGQGGGGTASQR